MIKFNVTDVIDALAIFGKVIVVIVSPLNWAIVAPLNIVYIWGIDVPQLAQLQLRIVFNPNLRLNIAWSVPFAVKQSPLLVIILIFDAVPIFIISPNL